MYNLVYFMIEIKSVVFLNVLGLVGQFRVASIATSSYLYTQFK